jgi:cell fate regulator YaaT (PSP1 superfamily)
MASSWIVRHGAMRFLGTFDADTDSYLRGQEVIVRTERGLEVGQLLCLTTPHAVELIAEPTHGRIVRLMTEQDRAERERLHTVEESELETCARFVQQRRLQM